MEMKEKIALIEEALDTEEGILTPETQLDSLEEWDSIAMLSLIAMLDERFGKAIGGKELKTVKTVKDILVYME